MLSMTGFGSGEGTVGSLTVMVEFRSVNHRFLDVSLKLPGSLAVYEGDIRKFLKDNVARGRVTVMAQLQLARDVEIAGLDPERPLEAQRDSFWWSSGGFHDQKAPFASFKLTVRGFDPGQKGFRRSPHFLTLDKGCGFGGPLVAACFSTAGEILELVEA